MHQKKGVRASKRECMTINQYKGVRVSNERCTCIKLGCMCINLGCTSIHYLFFSLPKMSSFIISNIDIVKTRLTQVIQITDSPAYRFQQYQEVFQMMKNYAEKLKKHLLRFVQHVKRDTEA